MNGMYLVFGLLTAILGALPIGAANLVVVNAALQRKKTTVNQLILSAGLGELIVLLLSLLFSMQLRYFLQEYYWIRVVLIFLFLSLGLYFLKFRNKHSSPSLIQRIKKKPKPLLLGFILAIVNPPVFLYWITAITIVNQYALPLSATMMWQQILVFLIGIFMGKIIVLYGYAYWGLQLAKRSGTIIHKTSKIYTTIGIALVLISLIQSIHLMY